MSAFQAEGLAAVHDALVIHSNLRHRHILGLFGLPVRRTCFVFIDWNICTHDERNGQDLGWGGEGGYVR